MFQTFTRLDLFGVCFSDWLPRKYRKNKATKGLNSE
jgi:hypothetical protein